MAISEELAAAISAGYNEFVGTINKQSERYLNTQANCNAIRRLLRSQGIPDESLQHPAFWVTAWAEASGAGLLEEPAGPETPEQAAERERDRIARLNAKDRYDGSPLGNRDKESPREKALKLKNDVKEASQAVMKRLKDIAEAKPTDKSKIDLSVLPSVDQLRAGEGLPEDQLRRLSGAQLRIYVSREQEAKRRNDAQRSDDKRKAKGS